MISSCIEEDKPYTLIVLLTIFTTLENNVLKHRKKEVDIFVYMEELLYFCHAKMKETNENTDE